MSSQYALIVEKFDNPQVFDLFFNQSTTNLKSIRLKRKEANIDDWHRNKIAEAREKMRNTEVCLITVVIYETDNCFPKLTPSFVTVGIGEEES